MQSLQLNNRKKDILGLPIHDITMDEILEIVIDSIRIRDKIIIYGFSGAIFPILKKYPEYVDFLNDTDIVVSDGAGLPLIARLFGISLMERIGLPNLVIKLLELSNDNSYRVFILGASENINKLACNNIKNKYPQIGGCDGHHGFFTTANVKSIIEKINSFYPDILLIGMSTPMKERFAINNKEALNTCIILPCGGMIDVIAGKTKRPPKIIEKIYLTWFFRFIQEPVRLFNNTIGRVLHMIIIVLPIMLIKHYFTNEKNPSVVNYYRKNK